MPKPYKHNIAHKRAINKAFKAGLEIEWRVGEFKDSMWQDWDKNWTLDWNVTKDNYHNLYRIKPKQIKG